MSIKIFAIALKKRYSFYSEVIRLGIGRRIKFFVQREGISLRQLSIRAHVPYSTLYSIVQRDSNGVDSETLERIASALNISLIDLLFDVEDMLDMFNFDDYIEKMESGATRLHAFLKVIKAVGYDVHFSKNKNGEEEYTFIGATGKSYEITEKQLVDMLHDVLGYAEYSCIKFENSLQQETSQKGKEGQ